MTKWQAPAGSPGGSVAATSDAPAVRPITISTEGLPPSMQFEAWRRMCVPYMDAEPPAGTQEVGFAARSIALPFGACMFYGAVLPAYDYRRTAAQIRRDSLDHWIVAMLRRGAQRQRSGDVDIDMRQGVPYVLSMATAFEAQRAGAEIEWLSLFVARDAVVELEPRLSAALYTPLDTPMGRLLADFLIGLHREATALTPADLPRLSSMAVSMLSAALGGAPSSLEAARPQLQHLQLARLKRLVRDNLGAATLGPGRLCRLGGVSRSALYRLFEPLGGVARFIQRERLAAAHRALTDRAERRGIAEIAESVGFFEPSSFSRAFRAEFGLSPRDARSLALAGVAGGPARALFADRDAAADLGHVLRRL